MNNYFNPDDLINLSKQMVEDNEEGEMNEAEIRTVYSNCYYGCYLMIKKDKGKFGHTDHLNHGETFSYMNKESPLLGNYYFKLYAHRRFANYNLKDEEKVQVSSSSSRAIFNVKIDEESAEEIIDVAMAIRDRLKKS